MSTNVTAQHSILSDKDDRSLVSVFSAYVVSATLWLVFATGVAGSGPAMAGPPTAASATASANVTSPAGGYDAAKAATLYTTNCSSCHQANGEGLPGAFPSLRNDAVVDKDDATKHIQVVLQGMHDARVSGVVYTSAMPPFAGTLSDAEIADIIDYERSSWGNHGKPVDAAQVAAERAKSK
jgi:cytochrome c oxidase cbb3-type subunit 2